MKKHDDHALTDQLNEIAFDVTGKIWREKRLIPIVLGVLCIAAAVFFFTSVLPLVKEAEEIGRDAGVLSGQAAGAAVGSVEGVTQGLSSGYDDGREAGLSAQDTVVEIANELEADVKSLGCLQVLVANVEIPTYQEVGKKSGALYLLRGSTVFTIDLNEVVVTHGEGLIQIILPKPQSNTRIDPTETKIIAEWQNKFFNGTDSDGFQGYLNTFSTVRAISDDEIANYDFLIRLASDSAKRQVEEIVNSVRIDSGVRVTVDFRST